MTSATVTCDKQEIREGDEKKEREREREREREIWKAHDTRK